MSKRIPPSLAISALIIFILLVLLLSILLFIIPFSSSEEIIVDSNGGGDYTEIRYAVENASAGDHIRIWDGDYKGTVTISKPLTLTGNGTDSTTVGNGQFTWGFFITSPEGVQIQHLTVKDTGYGGILLAYNFVGVYPDYENNIISNVSIENSSLVCYSGPVEIRDCTLMESSIDLASGMNLTNVTINGKPIHYLENQDFDEGPLVIDDGGAVFLYRCSNVVVRNLTMNSGGFPIELFESRDITIENNTIVPGVGGQVYYGIYLLGSDDCRISQNIIHDVLSAIYVVGSNNIIEANHVENAMSGILVRDLNNPGSVTGNLIRDNVLVNASFIVDFHENNVVNNTMDGKQITVIRDLHKSGDPFVIHGDDHAMVFIENSSNIELGDLNLTTRSNYGIHLLHSENVVIRYSMIQGHDDSNHPGFGPSFGILVENCRDIFVLQNTITNNYGGGISIQGGSRITIDSNNVSGNQGDGIYLTSSNSSVFRNYVRENHDGHGIHISAGKNNLIEFNHVTGNEKHGIHIYAHETNVSANVVKQNGEYGISVPYSDNIIRANEIKEHINEALFVIGDNNQILENEIEYDGPGSAFYIREKNEVVGNTLNGRLIYFMANVHGTSDDPVIIDGDAGTIILYRCSFFRITNNEITGNDKGIYIGNSEYIEIVNNVIHNNSEFGINIWGSKSITVRDNIVRDNLYGFNFSYFSDDLLVINNTFTSNQITGLTLVLGDNCQVRENRIYENGGVGFRLGRLGSGNSIEENYIYANPRGWVFDGYESTLVTDTRNILWNNFIFNNTEYGVLVDGWVGDIDLRWNWWGDPSGPFEPKENPTGKGNNVSGSLLFTPWHTDTEQKKEIESDDHEFPAYLCAMSSAIVIFLAILLYSVNTSGGKKGTDPLKRKNYNNDNTALAHWRKERPPPYAHRDREAHEQDGADDNQAEGDTRGGSDDREWKPERRKGGGVPGNRNLTGYSHGKKGAEEPEGEGVASGKDDKERGAGGIEEKDDYRSEIGDEIEEQGEEEIGDEIEKQDGEEIGDEMGKEVEEDTVSNGKETTRPFGKRTKSDLQEELDEVRNEMGDTGLF